MIGMIKRICRMVWIGDEGCDGGSDPGVTWDSGVPWDERTGWL